MILKTGYRPNGNSAATDAPSVGEVAQRRVEPAGLFVSQTRVHDFGQPAVVVSVRRSRREVDCLPGHIDVNASDITQPAGPSVEP